MRFGALGEGEGVWIPDSTAGGAAPAARKCGGERLVPMRLAAPQAFVASIVL
jgi:hypothetical protein